MGRFVCSILMNLAAFFLGLIGSLLFQVTLGAIGVSAFFLVIWVLFKLGY